MRKCKVPTIETERLCLRMWNRKDAADLFAYAQNPNVGPIAGWKPHANVEESRFIITNFFMRNMVWAIVDKESGRAIGSIGFSEDRIRPGINSRELGYSMSEDYWGRGLMTEAAGPMIKYAFETLKLDVLTVTTRENNMRSRRVIEKCGFRYEGTLRRTYRMYDGSIKTIMCYSMLKEEYEANRKGCEADG